MFRSHYDTVGGKFQEVPGDTSRSQRWFRGRGEGTEAMASVGNSHPSKGAEVGGGSISSSLAIQQDRTPWHGAAMRQN